MRKGLRLLLAAGAVASALLAGCGGQAPEPKPEPKLLELVVSGVSDGGVVEGSAEVCVDVRNASSGFDAELTYSLSGPSGLREAYGDYGVDTSTLDGSLSGHVPVSGEWCETIQPEHSGVYTVTVRVPGAGLEESFSVEFDEPQFNVYGWTDGVTVPPGTRLTFNVIWEIGEAVVRAEVYKNGSLSVVADPYPLDTPSFSLPSGKGIFMHDGWVQSDSPDARLDIYFKRKETLEELWHGYWYTTN